MPQYLNYHFQFRPMCILYAVCGVFLFSTSAAAQSAHIRVNQAGYLPADAKVAIAFSKTPLQGDFVLLDAASNRTVFRSALKSVPPPDWGGGFPYYYELDFSSFTQPGRNLLRLEAEGTLSKPFAIGEY